MAATIDELTVSYTEEGIETVKELEKVVLTRGAWTTILFRQQDWDRKKEAYAPEKYSIRRYQKRNGEYMLRSKFVISSADQAQQLIDHLSKWVEEAKSTNE